MTSRGHKEGKGCVRPPTLEQCPWISDDSVSLAQPPAIECPVLTSSVRSS